MKPDSDADQKKLDRLARVRENQRKSRARRQEYIQELEQQLAVYKAQAHQKDIEHRISIQKLEAENAKLRHLLSSLGVQPSSVDEYLQGHSNPVVTQKVAIPALPRPEPPLKAACRKRKSPRSSSVPLKESTSEYQPDADYLVAESTGSEQLITNNSSATELDQDKSHPMLAESNTSSGNEAVCGCLSNNEEKEEESWPANESALNTTLCAIAGELIHQYNTRGLDLTEIRNKLRVGFRRGMSTGEGCRVQNQVLFEVLNEISSNLS
ncbi:hypothetical protein VTN00DRAFT_2236 [Thermoascus crustaceus]|uniref:uncharacterized protein n=1 Tax=Thermoascus crustaceus TaxID=5088 RepID=UPI0037428889